MLRRSAVAGSFYPESSRQLKREIVRYLDPGHNDLTAYGIVVPHAGYVYSGAIAAEAYKILNVPQTVILLGPNHRGLGATAAVYSCGAWQTPLGEVSIDESLAAQLLAKCDLLKADPAAHEFEHSIEVQIPFLQMLRNDLQIVPITLGQATADQWLQLGRQLAAVLSQREERALLVASSDMNHFASATVSAEIDMLAIRQMENFDPLGLYHTVQKHKISMCGVIPAMVMLEASKQLGAQSCR
ncbi:MAG: AmmeMemoRadiSam system protein B, partial [Geopsychrobacter sp.]|nr:AmmeMemoRadiSam system protein B [Geopsychrobacter sp.]